MRRGVAFVTTSSATEYPMTWREVVVKGAANSAEDALG